MIQACLNGALPAGFHPRLPLTPAALAADAAAVRAAGADDLHLHVRAPDLTESLAPGSVAATLRAVRAAVPGMPVGISTGGWIEADDARRLQHVRAWTELPDHASGNLVEPGAVELMQVLLERGIGVEAGLASVEDARALVRSGQASRCRSALIEIPACDPAEAAAQADAIRDVLATARIRLAIQVHGFERSVRPLVDQAFRWGHATRVGLEDTDLLPDGSVAADNAALVGAALSRRPPP